MNYPAASLDTAISSVENAIACIADVDAAAVGALVEPRRSETGIPLPALFPTVGGAFASGELGVDTADAISRELSVAAPRAAVDGLVAAERALVGQTTGNGDVETGADGGGASVPVSADLIRVQARAWRDALDPDGVEPRADRAKQNRAFWVSRTPRDGLHKVGGGITSDVAATLLSIFDTVLSPHTRPMFLPDGDDAGATLADAGDVSVVDTRTPGQQRADVLAAMARAFLGSDEFSVPPGVLVTIDADTYTAGRGTGTISGTTTDWSIPAS